MESYYSGLLNIRQLTEVHTDGAVKQSLQHQSLRKFFIISLANGIKLRVYQTSARNWQIIEMINQSTRAGISSSQKARKSVIPMKNKYTPVETSLCHVSSDVMRCFDIRKSLKVGGIYYLVGAHIFLACVHGP